MPGFLTTEPRAIFVTMTNTAANPANASWIWITIALASTSCVWKAVLQLPGVTKTSRVTSEIFPTQFMLLWAVIFQQPRKLAAWGGNLNGLSPLSRLGYQIATCPLRHHASSVSDRPDQKRWPLFLAAVFFALVQVRNAHAASAAPSFKSSLARFA